MLIRLGKIVAASAHRFGLRGVERGRVILDGGHVLGGGFPIVEQVFGLGGPQEVGAEFGLVERDRQRIAHVGHERKVQQLGDVEFVLEPTIIGAVVLVEDAPDRAPLGRAVVGGGPAGGRVGQWRPVGFPRLLVGAPPVGAERARRGHDRARQRQDHDQQLRQPE